MNETRTILELKETIKLKDREISEIKNSVANILQQIRDINESNNYSASGVKRRKISEICTDKIYELLLDEKEPSTDSQIENR